MTKNFSKKSILMVALIAMALLFASCALASAGTPETIKSSKDRLVYVITTDPLNMDPHDSTLFGHHHITRQMYETLVARDRDMNLVPCLAESWKYEDDLTLVFTLRKGVKFHNGEELKASDVFFTLKRASESTLPGSQNTKQIDFDKTEVRGDYEIAIVTKTPYPLQLPMLENSNISIFSEKGYKDNNGDFNKASFGTGAFKFVRYTPGDSVLLKANENYRIAGLPYVKEILFRIINDASSRAIEAETGGADIVYGIDAVDIPRLAANPKLSLTRQLTSNTTYVAFNTQDKVLSNPLVRKAISHAMNRDAALKVAYGDFGKLAKDGIFSPGLDGRHPNLEPFIPQYDSELAKKLLAEAGYPDGLTVEIVCENDDSMRKNFCEALQAQFANAGITLKLDFTEANVWTEKVLTGKAQLAIYGFSATTGEVGRNLLRWLRGSSDFKMNGYEGEELQEVVNEALRTIDDEKRFALYHKAQEIIISENLVMPYWFKEACAATQPKVRNFWICPTYETVFLQEVYVE